MQETPTMTRERAIQLAADQGDTVTSVLGAVMVKAITREEGGGIMARERAEGRLYDATVSMHGVEVTICKSSGSDGASIVFIDTAIDDVNDDGTLGTPRVDDDEGDEAA